MEYPFTPGVEAAGVVSALGEGVAELAVGDRVAIVGTIGAYAESFVIPADRCVAVPDEVELDIAAAAMLQAMTAHYLITCLLYTSPSPRDQRGSRMPSSA